MKKLLLTLSLVMVASSSSAFEVKRTSTICDGKIKVIDYGSEFDAPVEYIEVSTGKKIAGCGGRRGCFSVANPEVRINEEEICKLGN
jgi:hypothetical protein